MRGKEINFLTANIDRAIVLTQYDLRGYLHPFGARLRYLAHAKYLDASTCNFMVWAAGSGFRNISDREAGTPTDKDYVGYHGSSFAEYLAMCKRLAKDCSLDQKESIQLIVQEIVKQSEEMKTEVAAGKREETFYLKSHNWGKAVLSLVEAFEVKLKPWQRHVLILPQR